MKMNIDESDNNEWFDLTLFLLNNSITLDKAKQWSLLLFKEALAIHRQKLELNHGIKASREVAVFFLQTFLVTLQDLDNYGEGMRMCCTKYPQEW